MKLTQWQKRLATNFDDVTLAKLDLPHEPVTFALEHGLEHEELDGLARSICENVGSLDLDEYLCWAVYSAEVGYQFAGDEYWHTFHDQTPGWDQRNRPFIKQCFERFSKEYNGAIPRGTWAQHYSIICWPITHAILPKDLQRQLAQVLYRIRHSIAVDDIESPGQLGRIIATHSHTTSSRFKQLATEFELIGQIASALLRDDRTGEWIETKTLARISADLGVAEQSRSWLSDARQQVTTRATLRGLKRASSSDLISRDTGTRTPRPQVRPIITLRSSGNLRWQPVLEAPNLTPFTRYYPDFQPLFENASVCFAQHDRRYPARALLHSSVKVQLSKWPLAGASLLTFDPSHPNIDSLLEHAALMPNGPWLFRVNTDGVAREVRSRRVSIGGEYIVVTNVNSASKYGREIDIGSEDFCGWHFEVSNFDEIKNTLDAWNLEAAHQVIAKPCALTPSFWDRQGAVEWLSTDNPIVCLKTNYTISRFTASMDVGQKKLSLDFEPSTDNYAYLVLPRLPAGVYHLDVVAHPIDATCRTERGEIEITIRDVSPDNNTGMAMLVAQDPSDGTLTEFIDAKVQVEVLGPSTRNVSLSLSLYKKGKLSPLNDIELTTMNLPVSKSDFMRYVNSLGADRLMSNAFAEAERCTLRFDGADLGVIECTYDRPQTALRWGLTKAQDSSLITLYDDVDNPSIIETYRYDFSTPLKARVLRKAALIKASTKFASPGLYVARFHQEFAATIVSPTIKELRKVKPQFKRAKRTVETLETYIEALANWYGVETRGDLFGRVAWSKVMQALVHQLIGLIGGTHWYKAENAYQRDKNIEKLGESISFKHYGIGWSEQLINAVDDTANSNLTERIRFLSATTKETQELCEFALRLSSTPTTIDRSDPAHFRRTIEAIMQQSELIRAARFVVLTTAETVDDSEVSNRAIYSGWQWK